MASRSSQSALAGCLVITIMAMACGFVKGEDGSALANKCSSEFTKVTACLNYATGKADQPTKDCCGAVTDIRGKDPACLCYFIQQTHNGSQQIKSLGILESRLLLLPSACALKNVSISECPKLLGIPPTSPDYAIFSNNASTTAPTGTPSSPETATNNDSGVAKHGPQFPTSLLILVAIFLSAFPIGPSSKFFGSL